MNIVYNCDDNYIKYASVSMASLLENNREEAHIHIYMLTAGPISENSKKGLHDLIEGYGSGRELSLRDISDIKELIKERGGADFDTGRFGTAALGRIFAPELIPEAGRLLYIDSDTLVNGSLSHMYRMRFSGGRIAAMAMEPTIYPEVRAAIGFSEEEPYFNSGVILMDAEAWRREDITGRACRIISEYKGELRFPDQDILNRVLKGRVQRLPQRYNFFSGYYYRRYSDLAKVPGFSEECSRESFLRAKRKPVIIHFAGDERPWIAGNLSPYRGLYRSYRRLSPWRDEPDIRGRRAYMLFYHLVNVMTFICPGLREMISRIYYIRRFGKDSL